MDFSNIEYGELKTMARQLGVYPPDVIAAINAEIARRESEMQANAANQPSPTPIPDNPNAGVMNVDVQPPAGYYERQELEAKNAGSNQPVQPPAYLEQDAQNAALGQAKVDYGNQVARENTPITDKISYPAITPFDEWQASIPVEEQAAYGITPEPTEVPNKPQRVFTVPAQKPAGMPSRVWEQMNPSKSTETTVTTIPTASQQNPYLGPTVQDPSSYSLNNMNKLQPGDHGIVYNGRRYKLTSDELNQWMDDNLPSKESSEQPEQPKKDTDKVKKSEERSKKIKDIVTKAAESDDIGETGEQIASTASAMLADAANVGGSVDPSGTSATLRAQADTAAKQAALMDARRQAADRIWNRDLKAEADKKAAAGAAAENAQRIASTAAGESTVGQRGVKTADYNYEEGRADTARKEGTELSKDANQYQNAAYQRTMDAQKADYDYNENRKINNRIYQLTGGIGVKKDDGSYQVVGGNRDKDNNPVNPEQQPTGNNTQPTNNGNNNTKPADNGNSNDITPDNGDNNTAPATPTPTPASTTSTSTPGSNLANIQDKKQERLDKRDTGTSTPEPEPAAPAENMTVKTLRYANALQQWASLVSKYTRSGQINYDRNAHKEIEAAAKEVEAAYTTGLPKYNLSDMRADNVSRIWRQIQSWQKRFGGN